MKFQLNKWYFDFSSDSDLGYYYIMSLKIGFWRVGASGIYHFDHDREIRSFRFSNSCRDSIHQMNLTSAHMKMLPKMSCLQITHKDVELSGKWHLQTCPLKRIKKPLYQDEFGWCDWKVWSPYSKVDLSIRNQIKKNSLHGIGYIDLVRFAIPFWKIPIKSLYWGHLYYNDSWIILFKMISDHKSLALYCDPRSTHSDISVSVKRNRHGRIESFEWCIGSGSNTTLISVDTLRCLENQDILDRKPLSQLFPKKILKRFSSFGTDRKYLVQSTINGQNHLGIMEEVIWNE